MDPNGPETPDAIALFKRDVWLYTALVIISSFAGTLIASSAIEHRDLADLTGSQKLVIVTSSVAYLMSLVQLIKTIVQRCKRLETGYGTYIGLLIASIFILFPFSLIIAAYYTVKSLTRPTS